MLKKTIYILVAIAVLLTLSCGESDDIVGSKKESLDHLEPVAPYLLADGVSSTIIIAAVRDSAGKPASDLPVHFETTAGSITEQSMSDNEGNAYATLKSAASINDIEATVTATVLDTSLSLPKKNLGTVKIELKLKDLSHQSAQPIDLKKTTAAGDNEASITIMFLGITLTAKFDVTALPADGISTARLETTLKETTSKRAITNAVISLAAAYGTISSSIKTNDQGTAETNLKSFEEALTDTIYLEYGDGDVFHKILTIEYQEPQMNISPKISYLIADGSSKKTFTVAVKSQKNTPIVNAEIKFSTTKGTIVPSSMKTNSEGLATATLTSAAEVDTNVVVIAELNTFADTAHASFIEPLLSLTPKTGNLAADGTSQLSFTASLFLPDNTPVIGAEIRFSTSAGTISPSQGMTNSEGKISATLKSGFEANENVVVTAAFQELIDVASVQFLSPTLTLSPKSTMLLANGSSRQTFTATLLSPSNAPIPDAEIQFSTTRGTISKTTAMTNSEGKAYTELRSSTEADSNVLVIAKFHEIEDTSKAVFVASETQTGLQLSGETQLLRDGTSTAEITALVKDESGNPVPDATIFFSSLYGEIPETAVTNSAGSATVTYTTDLGESNATEEITANVGSSVATHTIELLGLTMTIYASPDSIPADGSSTSEITVQLKLTESQLAVPGINITFSSDIGYIATGASTNEQGVAQLTLRSATEPGTATVRARYGQFVRTTEVKFYLNSPQSLLLSANPSFIWVKETGNLEQTVITATVLGVQGTPIGHDVPVKFYLQNGPGGGAGFVVAGGEPSSQSEPIMTSNGIASIGFRSGIRSGTVEIRAELVDNSSVAAQTTNLVIRSGPPYIWIDPSNPNNVVSHMTLTLDYFNLQGWSYLMDYQVSVLIGDRYNNPVESGTTVYFTTTGGVITTDVSTNERGMGKVILASGQPRPYVCPLDDNYDPHTIENPNDPSVFLPIVLPDFEYGQVVNSCGGTDENDGIPIILAYTHGRDQNGNEAKVFATTKVVFGGPIAHYEVYIDPPVDTLRVGQTAQIHIKVWDINGNPPAAGSSLTASTSKGSVSPKELMSNKETYGFGSTYYRTTLVNNLDPIDDEPGVAEVTIELKTPFGKIAETVYIYLLIS